jgi:hypothetical protein
VLLFLFVLRVSVQSLKYTVLTVAAVGVVSTTQVQIVWVLSPNFVIDLCNIVGHSDLPVSTAYAVDIGRRVLFCVALFAWIRFDAVGIG